jgi:hypothetical protein
MWLSCHRGTIVYNLEQIDESSSWCSPTYLRMLQSCQVWDYSAPNIASLTRLGVTVKVRHVPVGYVPELTRIAAGPAEDIDVLFYGSMNERRNNVISQLRQAGLNAHTVFGMYGPARDALIARSKVVLNMHYYEANIFELVRVSYLLANRKAVVAECKPGTKIGPRRLTLGPNIWAGGPARRSGPEVPPRRSRPDWRIFPLFPLGTSSLRAAEPPSSGLWHLRSGQRSWCRS